MDIEFERRAEAAFSRISVLPLDAQARELIRLCEQDKALWKRVKELMDAATRAPFFLDGSLVEGLTNPGVEPTDMSSDPLPARIGDCKIGMVIGTGGMGVVYSAMQENPRRPVAVKVVRTPGMNQSILNRFRREAEALGRLVHPGIARVYSAGVHTDASGVFPYLVMELVPDARSLVQYVKEERLTRDQRLRLFIEICEAVHAAHTRMIVHRDLKPANILVGSDGRARVIDFGIAKAMDPLDSRATITADASRIVGTIHYMSPELLTEGSDAATVRSDIYSLGVVLLELIAGKRPFGSDATTIYEVMHRVVTGAPRPDRALFGELPRDLAMIIRKAIHTSAEQRYESVHAIAEDIRRFLRRQPVSARAPSRMYVARKFIERHPAATIATIAVAIALTALTTISVIAKQREHGARLLADEKAEDASRELYRALIGDAARAIEDGDSARAAAQLARTPVEWRSWEHRWLSGFLDNAHDRVQTGATLTRVRIKPNGVIGVYGPFGLGEWNDELQWEQVVVPDERRERPPMLLAAGGATDTRVFGRGTGDLRSLITLEFISGSTRYALPVPLVHIDHCELDPSGRRAALSGVGPDHRPRSLVIDLASKQIVAETGHAGPIRFWPDAGSLVVGGSAVTRIDIDGPNSQESRLFSGDREIYALDVDARGRTMVARGDHRLVFLNAESGQIGATCPVGGDGAVAVDETGTYAAAANGSELRVFRASDGAEIARLTGPAAPITCIALSREPDLVVAADAEGVMHRWTGRLRIGERMVNATGPLALASSSPAMCFVAASPEGVVQLVSFRDDTASKPDEYPIETPTAPVAISPDGSRLAVADAPSRVRVIAPGGVVTDYAVGEGLVLLERIVMTTAGVIWKGSGPQSPALLGSVTTADGRTLSMSGDLAAGSLMAPANEDDALCVSVDQVAMIHPGHGTTKRLDGLNQVWLAATCPANANVAILQADGLIRCPQTQRGPVSGPLPWPATETAAMAFPAADVLVMLSDAGQIAVFRPSFGVDPLFTLSLGDGAKVQTGSISPAAGVAAVIEGYGARWFPMGRRESDRNTPPSTPTSATTAGPHPESTR